jgi:Protein of unknown function DUF2625
MPARTLQDLIDQSDSMWPIIEQWVASASHTVEVLPVDRDTAEVTLLALQVTTRSPLGALAYSTGGVLIDSGWLRLLGASSERMRLSVLNWNGLREPRVPDLPAGAFVVAHDVTGGFFATNLGAFGPGARSVHYFAPDRLRWEDLGMSHAELVHWAITGDLNTFYETWRWPRWEAEIAGLSGDEGISFWPMLWSAGEPVAVRSRKAVPLVELWSMQRELARHLADLPPGTKVRLEFTE